MVTRDGLDSWRSWVIASASSIINFLILAPARLSGQLFVFFMERYNIDRETASFPFTVCFILRTLSGPLAGFLAQTFGLRKLSIIGCVLSTIGVGLCFISEEIISVTIFLGVIYGLGYGFVCSLVPEFLNLYFDRHLSKANGIAMGGACLGAFLLPPLIEYTAHYYGVSGMMLIFSGLVLHSVPASMMLVRPNFSKKLNTEVSKQDSDSSSLTTDSSKIENGTPPRAISCTRTHASIESSEAITDTLSKLDVVPHLTTAEYYGRMAFYNPSFIHDSFKITSKNNLDGDNIKNSLPVLTSLRIIRPSISVDKFYNSKISKPEKELKGGGKDFTAVPLAKFKKKRTACGSFRVFLDPVFILISIVQSSYFFTMFVVWTVIVDFVRDKNIDANEDVYFVMCLSISDLFGRVGLGWVTDSGYMTKMNFSAVSFFLMGTASCLLPLTSGFWLTFVIVFFYGFISGGIMIVFPGMVMQFISKEKRTMAMASRTILNAPMSVTISPLIGFFRETHGSYNGIFYLVAILSLICAGVSLSIPCLANYRNKKKSEGLPGCQTAPQG